jgi:hypothetical protein
MIQKTQTQKIHKNTDSLAEVLHYSAFWSNVPTRLLFHAKLHNHVYKSVIYVPSDGQNQRRSITFSDVNSFQRIFSLQNSLPESVSTEI